MVQLPEKYINNILFVHKDRGEKWLDELNDLITYCEQRWSFQVQEPFELSFNFVAPAMFKDGSSVVLKLSVPNPEYTHELEALKLFKHHNRNMVRLLDSDSEKGIMILERLLPGEMLASIEDDEQATRIASRVMKNLWIPARKDSPLPTIESREKSLLEISKNYPNGIGPISHSLLEEARVIFKQANDTAKENYVLHGDLHHYNMLSNETDSWMIIDPKGLIGEREYDIIQFLMNKLPDGDFMKLIEKRIDIFLEEIGLNKERILMWGVCHSILSTAWSVNDEGEYDLKFFQSISVFKTLYYALLDRKQSLKINLRPRREEIE
jgi:streptomycin 6-kinase